MKTRILLVIALIVALSSCLTVDKIQRNCDKFAKICTAGVETKTVYRDTLILLDPIQARLPESKINVSFNITVKDGIVNLAKQTFKKGLITTDVSIVNNKLIVNSFLNDSSILIKPKPITIKNAIRESATNTTLEPVIKKVVPGFYKFTFWFFIMLITSCLIYAGFKLKYKIIKVFSKLRP